MDEGIEDTILVVGSFVGLFIVLSMGDVTWSLWSVGSIKLYVSFAEYCLFYRALLQKRPEILRSLEETAPYL